MVRIGDKKHALLSSVANHLAEIPGSEFDSRWPPFFHQILYISGLFFLLVW